MEATRSTRNQLWSRSRKGRRESDRPNPFLHEVVPLFIARNTNFATRRWKFDKPLTIYQRVENDYFRRGTEESVEATIHDIRSLDTFSLSRVDDH